jgi:hypothetical protein
MIADLIAAMFAPAHFRRYIGRHRAPQYRPGAPLSRGLGRV